MYGRKKSHQATLGFWPQALLVPKHSTISTHTVAGQAAWQGFSLSLLFDSSFEYWFDQGNSRNNSAEEPLPPQLPSELELLSRVWKFTTSLHISAQKREMEQSIRDQSQSILWYWAQRHCITASYLAKVHCRLLSTPPQSLVLQIQWAKKLEFPPLIGAGWKEENMALKQCDDYQHAMGHKDLYMCQSGSVMSENHPCLGHFSRCCSVMTSAQYTTLLIYSHQLPLIPWNRALYPTPKCLCTDVTSYGYTQEITSKHNFCWVFLCT